MAKIQRNAKKQKRSVAPEIQKHEKKVISQVVAMADNDNIENSHAEKIEVENDNVSTEDENEDGASVEDSENGNAFEDDHEEVHQNEGSKTTSLSDPLTFPSDGRYHNKQRCLTICSRGVTSRHRHFLEDLRTLIPHHKKDSKLDAGKTSRGGVTGGTGAAINEISEMRGCNTVLFLESRKRQDAYLWIGRSFNSASTTSSTSGPSAKFLVENIHTMDELRLTGNCMKGSRPVLTFDKNFEQLDHLKLLKCLFTDIFGTPRGHPKSKPFVDRVMGFYYADGKVWVRNYQIVEQQATNAKEAHAEKKLYGKAQNTSLVEIGPRFVLNPIRIFRGSFGGQTLYKNDDFVAPNALRAANMRDKGRLYEDRKKAQKKRKRRKEELILPEDPLHSVFH